MSAPAKDYATRREQLAAEIARQRVELGQAYGNLERPLHYAEYGLRGFGFLRKNPWVFMAAPALFSILTTAWGFRKKNPARTSPGQEQNIHAEKGRKPLQTWINRGWQAYQLYRRVRQFLP